MLLFIIAHICVLTEAKKRRDVELPGALLESTAVPEQQISTSADAWHSSTHGSKLSQSSTASGAEHRRGRGARATHILRQHKPTDEEVESDSLLVLLREVVLREAHGD